MATIEETPQRLRFGSYELDLPAFELRKHGLKVRISPQAFRVLGCLVERRGELVTRVELFQRLWPDDTHVEYEANLNAIIGVLRNALGDSARNPRFIETEHKLGYRFIAPVSSHVRAEVAAQAPDPPPARSRANLLPAVRTALLLVLAVTGGILLWHQRRGSSAAAPQGKLLQISRFLGVAGHPTFSPDGSEVAFHWNGAQRGDFDIYVLKIGSEDPRRITTDPADDTQPAWSPDGRDIAFLRQSPDGGSLLMLAPALGGPERVVTKLPRVRAFAWSPDGRWIAYSPASPDNPANAAENQGIRAVSLSTGRYVDVTPSGRGNTDSFPAFSRDGSTLAFTRRAELWKVAIDRNLKPVSAPQRITDGSLGPQYPMWTPDGASIVFAADKVGFGRLWKVPAGGGAVRPLEAGGEDVTEPAIDNSGGRLVYSRSGVVDSLNTVEACEDCSPEPPRKLLYSIKLARNPSCSPDGRQIAFESPRSGNMEIWLCDRDGSHPRQLTELGGPPAGTPNWSPDGKRLVFDARVPSGSAIFVIDASGGHPRQITDGSGVDLVPSWSRDGQHIYFSSKRSGQLQVWSMTADGRDPRQITRDGGFRAVEAYRGDYLFYAKGATRTEIWRVPAQGGEEQAVVSSLGYWQNFSVTPDGIYFVPVSDSSSMPIRFFNLASASARQVAIAESAGLQGLCALPGTRTLVLSRRESNNKDLMLLELPR